MIDVILPLGPLQANCYLLIHEETRKAIIVDPAMMQTRDSNGTQNHAEPIMIINTHGHGDHIGANRQIKEHYNIPLAIHSGDAHMLTNAEAISRPAGWASPPRLPISYWKMEIYRFIRNSHQVLKTSGHSPGGISLYFDGKVLTGDALFRMSIGRTDIPGTSYNDLIHGIKENLLTLPDETLVYPVMVPRLPLVMRKK